MPERDYEHLVAALRAKAERTEYDGERADLLAKADELEAKYLRTFTFIHPRTWQPSWRDDWLDSIVDDDYLYDE